MGLYLTNPRRGYNWAMPKINVYLPDDLADAVRDTGVPVSAICQRALEQAVRRVGAIRQMALGDLDDLPARLPQFTARAVTSVQLAAGRAREAGAGNVTSADLLHGMLTEGANLALQVLAALDIDPGSLALPAGTELGAVVDRLSPPPAEHSP